MLEVVEVTKEFKKKRTTVTALRDVSLRIGGNETLALVGESGSGKSTLAEIIIGLQEPTRGFLIWDGETETAQTGQAQTDPVRATEMRSGRKPFDPKKAQMVFQNPDRSMNPYWKVKEIVMEPMLLSGVSRMDAERKAADLIEQVKLPKSIMERRPSECSGGQKQRVAIARALALSPRLLVADEITSALDPATEEELLNLLKSLQRQSQMSILYITHRLETIGGFADRVAVMKAGSIVEMGRTDDIMSRPKSEYTKALLNACYFEMPETIF